MWSSSLHGPWSQILLPTLYVCGKILPSLHIRDGLRFVKCLGRSFVLNCIDHSDISHGRYLHYGDHQGDGQQQGPATLSRRQGGEIARKRWWEVLDGEDKVGSMFILSNYLFPSLVIQRNVLHSSWCPSSEKRGQKMQGSETQAT